MAKTEAAISKEEYEDSATDAIARALVLVAKSIAAGDCADNNENSHEEPKRK